LAPALAHLGLVVEQPLISFVIAVLKGEKYIARCLTSIRNQRFPSEQFEVLVVDNGSTDKTSEIVRDPGFKIEVIPRVSITALHNRGAKIARGNYLAPFDEGASS